MRRSLRVLHVSPSYYPATYWGGPVFSVYALNNALARMPEVELRVLTTDSAGPDVSDRVIAGPERGTLYPNQQVFITPRVGVTSVSPELLARLPDLVRWADVIHLTAVYSFPTIPTLIACRAWRKPLVWSPRGSILERARWKDVRRPRLKQAWEHVCTLLAMKDRALLHVTSENERAATAATLGGIKTIVVPNGVEIPEPIEGRCWRPSGRVRLMYMGRLHPIKAIDNLLRALALVRGVEVSLAIYGDGDAAYRRQLEHLARAELGLRDVEFRGEVTGQAKRRAFAEADVCIVPSHSENFCNVVVEALAHGVPVLASRGTPWARLVGDGCGAWVDNAPVSLAASISEIDRWPLAAMGKRGRELVTREYSSEVAASAMLAAYRQVIGTA